MKELFVKLAGTTAGARAGQSFEFKSFPMAEFGRRLTVEGRTGCAPVVGAADVDAKQVRPAGKSANVDAEQVSLWGGASAPMQDR
jgi:hypothetical protein